MILEFSFLPQLYCPEGKCSLKKTEKTNCMPAQPQTVEKVGNYLVIIEHLTAKVLDTYASLRRQWKPNRS